MLSTNVQTWWVYCEEMETLLLPICADGSVVDTCTCRSEIFLSRWLFSSSYAVCSSVILDSRMDTSNTLKISLLRSCKMISIHVYTEDAYCCQYSSESPLTPMHSVLPCFHPSWVETGALTVAHVPAQLSPSTAEDLCKDLEKREQYLPR